jgi:hypothetical protein
MVGKAFIGIKEKKGVVGLCSLVAVVW